MKTHKGDEKWPLLVNKQLFWWSAPITLDNNNAEQTCMHFSHLILYHIPQLDLLVVFLLYFSILNILTHMTTMLRVGSLQGV